MPYDASVNSAAAAAEGTLELLEQLVAVKTAAERRFVLLNQSRRVWPYQISVLWHNGALAGHSGVGQVELQGPYGQWLKRLGNYLALMGPGLYKPDHFDAPTASQWAQWWPPHALWLPAESPLPGAQPTSAPGPVSGVLLLRDVPWAEHEAQEIHRWWMLWRREDLRTTSPSAKLATTGGLNGWRAWLHPRSLTWRGPQGRKALGIMALVATVLLALVPVRLTVRAPGELVARDPLILRATIDGQVRQLHVEPNQRVKAGQLLAELDDAGWSGKLHVAQQALMTADAELRQVSQQALNDPKAKLQLAAAQGKFEERRAEVNYLSQQVQRSALVAPHDGVVLIQDPGSWSGRNVSMGEPVMKLARLDDQELEAWLPVGDAIDLALGAPMHLHLASRPGKPVQAKLRLYGFEAEHRQDLGLGYRLRGILDQPPSERLGARGTVRIDGPSVPLGYWVMRRPLATLREVTGW